MTNPRSFPPLEIRHMGGETRTVEVVGVARYSLIVVWPGCGEYKLDLKLNQLTRARAWGAVDIAKAREMWRKHNYGPAKADLAKTAKATEPVTGWKFQKKQGAS